MSTPNAESAKGLIDVPRLTTTVLIILAAAAVAYWFGANSIRPVNTMLPLREIPKDQILGVGATFPAPLYAQWISVYRAAHPDTSVIYEALGSGEGVDRFIEELVDFGASDAAMTDNEIAKVKAG